MFAGSGTAVAVCEPQPKESACGLALSSMSATSSGFARSLMSNTCNPSNPAGTICPSQVSPAPNGPGEPAGVFQERTRTFFQTTMSPWFPSQKVRETVKGLFGLRMFRMLKPSQFPW